MSLLSLALFLSTASASEDPGADVDAVMACLDSASLVAMALEADDPELADRAALLAASSCDAVLQEVPPGIVFDAGDGVVHTVVDPLNLEGAPSLRIVAEGPLVTSYDLFTSVQGPYQLLTSVQGPYALATDEPPTHAVTLSRVDGELFVDVQWPYVPAHELMVTSTQWPYAFAVAAEASCQGDEELAMGLVSDAPCPAFPPVVATVQAFDGQGLLGSALGPS